MMGYNTTYNIRTRKLHDLSLEISEIDGQAIWDYVRKLDHDRVELRQVYREDDCYFKWYDHDEHMLELSVVFPWVLFILSGEGEERGDLWRTYYLNGKLQDTRAVITYPTFDREMLHYREGKDDEAQNRV